MKKFWKKNDCFIRNPNGHFVRCETCPCGYYAIFGFRKLYSKGYYDSHVFQPYNCCLGTRFWNNDGDVFVLQVVNGLIHFNYRKQDYCFAVQQKIGLCGTLQFYDETDIYHHGGALTRYEVYQLTECYDTYQQALEAFYTPCGIEPTSGGIWPEFWQSSYWSGTYLSNEAQSCHDSYWWPYFRDRYKLNFKLKVPVLCLWWWETLGINEWAYEQAYSYDYCWNEEEQDYCYDQEYDEHGEIICPEGCIKKTHTVYEPTHPISIGCEAYVEMPRYAPVIYRYYNNCGGYWDGTEYHQTCADEQAAYAGAGPCENYIRQTGRDKSKYLSGYTDSSLSYDYDLTCVNDGHLCLSGRYSTGPAWNDWDSPNQLFIAQRWAFMKLQKNEYTPSAATGIKFLLQTIDYKYTTTWPVDTTGDYDSEYTDVVSSYISGYVTLSFGQQYNDFPTLEHYSTLQLVKNITCNGDVCDDCSIWTMPWYDHVYYDYEQQSKSQEIVFKLKAIQYVY